jgi:hypothetical protein
VSMPATLATRSGDNEKLVTKCEVYITKNVFLQAARCLNQPILGMSKVVMLTQQGDNLDGKNPAVRSK